LIPNKTFYLPGLNGIRAIAALLVVLSHINLRIGELGFVKGEGVNMAGYGVTMFFVLSGYLITTLLLKEHDKTGAISLRKFYLRRILRIWPIYYLALFVAVTWLTIDGQHFSERGLFFYVFLMANVPFVFGGVIHPVVQLWSVGVEEQFYLFWPWLFRWKNKLPYIMAGIIVLFFVARLILRIVENGNWYTFVGATQFHCMAVGGLGAWVVQNKKKFIKKIYHPILQLLCWSILLVSVYRPFHIFSIIDGELYAILFLIIIINVSTNPKTIVKLEHPVINWVGRISYGIYVYHMFAIIISFSLIKPLLPLHPGFEIAVYLLIICLTLIMSHISFHYFESRFLSKKQNFAVIPSTNMLEAHHSKIKSPISDVTSRMEIKKEPRIPIKNS
jgi:peptidoglycan/LPS O-acetylase OafA/YrhL